VSPFPARFSDSSPTSAPEFPNLQDKGSEWTRGHLALSVLLCPDSRKHLSRLPGQQECCPSDHLCKRWQGVNAEEEARSQETTGSWHLPVVDLRAQGGFTAAYTQVRLRSSVPQPRLALDSWAPAILPPWPPSSWDYRYEPPRLAR
jgi:hypothetical protein